MLRAGMKVSFHSDFMMAPPEPLTLAWCAANRRTLSGRTVSPEERLTLTQALRGVTIDAAWALRVEHEVGSIAAGKRADFCVMEDDPFELGVERLLCEYEVPDAYNKSLQFFALSADAAFDMTEMTAVFCHIMQQCEVDEAELERQIQFVHLKEEELSASFKVKQIRMVGARPRLRSKLAEIHKEARSVRDLYDFEGWSSVIGFPSVFSLYTRHKLYFLMAQTHVPDPMEHVSSLTRDAFVCNALKTAVVNTPEVDILYKVIASLKLIEEPFKELQDFRCECMGAFPATQLNAMKLNDLCTSGCRNLYTAADGFENSRNGHNCQGFKSKTF
jgi:hypothetical protein